jgi:hypothetical protein
MGAVVSIVSAEPASRPGRPSTSVWWPATALARSAGAAEHDPAQRGPTARSAAARRCHHALVDIDAAPGCGEPPRTPPADRTRGSATGEWRQHGQLHLGSNPREDREPVKRIAVDAPESLCRRICGWLRGRWSSNGRQPVRRAKCKRWPDQGVSGAATQMEPIVGGRRDGVVVVVGRVVAPAWR